MITILDCPFCGHTDVEIWAIRKIVWKTGSAAQQLNGDDNAINHANQPQ